MTSPESGSREPTTKAGKALRGGIDSGVLALWSGDPAIGEAVASVESEAVERFAEALVRAVEDATAPYWKDDMGMEPRLTKHPGLRQDEILALISALRSPADTGEHQEGDVGS